MSFGRRQQLGGRVPRIGAMLLVSLLLLPLAWAEMAEREAYAAAQAAPISSKITTQQLIERWAPVVLKKFLAKSHNHRFTEVSTKQLFDLYQYSATEIQEGQSVYANIAVWIAQTSYQTPTIFTNVEHGQICQIDNYFFHWEEQTKAFNQMKERRSAEKNNPLLRFENEIKDKLAISERLKKNRKKIKEIQEIFLTLKKQLLAIIKRDVADEEKGLNLRQRLARVDLVFADLEPDKINFSLKEALFDSPALNYANDIYVGPEMYKFPAAAIKLTLAHELAHSIDFLHMLSERYISTKQLTAFFATELAQDDADWLAQSDQKEKEEANDDDDDEDTENADIMQFELLNTLDGLKKKAGFPSASALQDMMASGSISRSSQRGRDLQALEVAEHPYWPQLKQWAQDPGLDFVLPENLAQLSAKDQERVMRNSRLAYQDHGFITGNFRGNEIFADYLASLVINEDLKNIADPLEQTRYALSAIMFNLSNAMDLRWANLVDLLNRNGKDHNDAAKDKAKSNLSYLEAVINAHLQFVLKAAGAAYPLVPARVNFYAQPELIKQALQADRLAKFREVYLEELPGIN